MARARYDGLKTLNPSFPFLVRATDAEPTLVATYGHGVTETRSLEGLTEAQISDALAELVALGEQHPRSWPASDDLPPAVVDAV